MVAIVGIVGGCRSSPDDPGVGRRFLDALNSHDPAQVTALLAPDATYEEPGRLGPFDTAALREHLARQWQTWNDQVYSARRIENGSGATVIEWETHQTHQNREPVRLIGVLVLEVHHERVDRVRNYFDSAPLMRLLRPGPS